MALGSPEFGQVNLDGVSVFGKFDESGRTVFVRSSRLALRGTGLVFNERSRILIADASGPSGRSSPATQLHVNYQIFAVPDLGTISHEQPMSQLRDFVLKTQWRRAQAHQLEVQNALLHELESIIAEGKLHSRLLIECPVRSTCAQ